MRSTPRDNTPSRRRRALSLLPAAMAMRHRPLRERLSYLAWDTVYTALALAVCVPVADLLELPKAALIFIGSLMVAELITEALILFGLGFGGRPSRR